MADRIKALTVTLERDIRVDDVEPLIAAITQLRGVANVMAEVANIDTHVAEVRVRQELGQKIMKIIYPD